MEDPEIVLNPEHMTHPENAFHALAQNQASDNSIASSSTANAIPADNVSNVMLARKQKKGGDC